MPASDTRALAITLPAALVSSGEPSILLLAIVADSDLKGGKRALTRNYRDSNSKDPARIRRVEWEVWGQIGRSTESTAQSLGIDFTQNLETRWERRLISAGAPNSVNLTTFDPTGTGSLFGVSIFGSPTECFGSSLVGGGVVVFDEQLSTLFAHRGQLSTQINMSTWAATSSKIQSSPVLDAMYWRRQGRIALGSFTPMQTRVSVGATSSVYADTQDSGSTDIYANAVKRGSDRAWYIDASLSTGTFNYVGYTLDAFQTLASPFQVGDPDVGTTGIGPFGPLTMFGAQDNLYSFTDQGKPVPLSRALINHFSDQNGKQWADPGWGWNYAITAIGLRAIQPGVDNPVGIGERMRGFTGHGGVPTAIWAERGELWVAYTTPAGDVYGYRGAFGAETAQTGQPLLFPWFFVESQTSTAIFSSATPTYPVIIRGADTNMTYQIISADGRDDLDPNYVYAVAGGTAYMTTLDRDANLLKTLRLARFHTRSMGSGDSWTLGIAFDPSPILPTLASYTTIGTVTSDGYSTITPVSNSAPIANISGRTMKPRLVQVAGSATASTEPPEVNGTLEIEYDERPDQIEEIEVIINLVGTGYSTSYIWDTLLNLVGQASAGPFAIQLPDDLPAGVSSGSGGGQKYAMVASVTALQDLAGSPNGSATLKLQVWPQADTI